MPKIYLSLFFLSVFTACTMRQPKEADTPAKITIKKLLEKQVLLTNHAMFSKDRELNGACAFLIYYKDSVYAVTAKHLIGPDGGVKPAITPMQLWADLQSWKMFPRQPVHPATDTVTVNAAHLDYSDMTPASDALLLSTVGFHGGIEPLTPNFAIPAEGDSLVLLGCPYSEQGCRQNSYNMIFRKLDRALMVCQIFSNVELQGFSGAPIINSRGEVVAILYGSGEVDGEYYVYATPIRDIKKVR
ncbi:MAG: trypsin-like peptidase domain-containing protein [Chitinophagaceae bacterium]